MRSQDVRAIIAGLLLTSVVGCGSKNFCDEPQGTFSFTCPGPGASVPAVCSGISAFTNSFTIPEGVRDGSTWTDSLGAASYRYTFKKSVSGCSVQASRTDPGNPCPQDRYNALFLVSNVESPGASAVSAGQSDFYCGGQCGTFVNCSLTHE